MAALFAADTFLARIERQESRAEAERLHSEGLELLRVGRPADAVDRLRTAMSMAQDNREYPVALARALAAAGRQEDAEGVLKDLLDRSSTDGPANLEMARLLSKSGAFAEAVAYYHRAIYGQWSADPTGNQRGARLELIGLLAKNGAKRELLAELLPMQDDVSTDAATRVRMARLYLQAGSPERSAEMFQQVLKRDSRNPDAYFGLGQAEFAQAQYPRACGHFRSASRLKPSDEEIKKRLALCEQIISLDPTGRGLDAREKDLRSRKLVELSLASLSQCSGAGPSSAASSDLIERAKRALKARVSQPEHDAEANLDLAGDLWQARRNQCPQPVQPAEEALAAVLSRTAR